MKNNGLFFALSTYCHSENPARTLFWLGSFSVTLTSNAAVDINCASRSTGGRFRSRCVVEIRSKQNSRIKKLQKQACAHIAGS
ncbi:hypothetical protein RCM42_00730, partial [Escherichia coli]|nr:hypothetical protein [Escherichia coli]MED9024822.1 hypothetical protein [Escherichia coli]